MQSTQVTPATPQAQLKFLLSASFKKARVKPNFTQPLVSAGINFLAKAGYKQTAEMITLCEKAYRPTFFSKFTLGCAQLIQNETQKAGQVLLVNLNPKMGEILRQVATKYNPKSAWLHINIGEFLLAKSDKEGTRKMLEKAVKLNPKAKETKLK